MRRQPPVIKPYVIRLYLAAFFAFLLVKGLVRPRVLEADAWIGWDIFVLSFPNLIEAIIGMTNTLGLLLLGRHYEIPVFRGRRFYTLLAWATAVASLYVVSQELGFHNLGGNNVTDPFDVIASVAGVGGMVIVFAKYGFFKDQPPE